VTTIINKYSDYKERWAARNTLHTTMIEQAAFDRNLYQSSAGSKHVELRFPEYVYPCWMIAEREWLEGIMRTTANSWNRIFNTGSPYNVSAGHGARNMDELVAHYEKLNADAEAKKVEAVKEGVKKR
jgi:hypothetical protein